MKWLNCSFKACEIGSYPIANWDDQPFPVHDQLRKSLGGSALFFRAADTCIKGDWAEYSKTFARANWATKFAPCILCFCTKENYSNDAGLGMDNEVGEEFRTEGYFDA